MENATNLTDMMNDLKTRVRFQNIPGDYTDYDYLYMISRGIKRLYVDTQRSSVYDTLTISPEVDEEGNETWYLNEVLPLDEREYVLVCSNIEFFKQLQGKFNDNVSYSTDAISVANADKPYLNIKDSVEKLEDERRITYYKMVRYAIGVG